MKTITLVLALLTFCFCASQAQDLPNDLTAISQADAPPFATYYSIAYSPDYPPLPWNAWDSAADLYYSPTYGTSYIWVDDRAKVAGRMLTESVDPPPIPGGDDSGPPCDTCGPSFPMYDWTTNFTDLWIWLDSYTNAGDGMTYFFTIHNTQSGLPYEIISSTNVAAPMNPTNWYSEGVWLATSTNLSAYVPMGGKTNRNFFRAHLWTDFTYGVPTNGQIFIQSLTNDIYPTINGITNHLTPFWSNWFVLNPRPTNLYALNLGYAMEDGGMTNSIIKTNPPQQVIRLVGFSKTLTNVCLSSNLLTTLNVSGWPALQDIQAWHNTNMLTVYVTNCPQLRRACFEALQGVNSVGITNALDFSGCPHIAEIRAADNRFPNVIVTNGAGPEVWHLCFHDNTVNQLPTNFNFSVYPSLRELWAWNDKFTGPLTLQTANSTNLQSVQMFVNDFKSADFTGQTNLFEVIMYYNFGLTNLNLTGCSKLRYVDVTSNAMSSSALDSVLSTLDSLGLRTDFVNTPQVYLNNSSIPSLDGQRHGFNLINKGWSVFYTFDSGAPFISTVSVPYIGSNYATITWTTDISSDSTVYYSTDGVSYFSTNVAGNATSHSLTFVGLTTATNYYFYVHSTSGGHTGTSGDYQFTTRGGPGIYFVNTATNVLMQIATNGSPSITWLWGDGTASIGGTSAGHSFTNFTTSAVAVNPASALTGFGLICGVTNMISSVTGLTNYPNLQDLYLYQSGVTNLSLAGCSNLVSIALVATYPSSTTLNGWFNDLAVAEPTMPGGSVQFGCGALHILYFPSSPVTNSTSAEACSNLTRIGWSLQHFP